MSGIRAVGRKYPEQAVTADAVPPFEITHPNLDKLFRANMHPRDLKKLTEGLQNYRTASRQVFEQSKIFPGLGTNGRSWGSSLSDTMEKYFKDEINPIEVAITSNFPFQSVCQLRLIFSYGTYIGTGWLAGPNTVVTVGHNVFGWNENDPESVAEWAESVVVAPGRFESEYFGFGPYECSDSISATAEWQKAADAKATDLTLDLAVLKLPAPVNQALQPFHTAVLDDATLLGNELTVCGYPNNPDEPHQTGRRQWSCSGEITRVTPTHIFYRLDTWGGHSGSPLWATIDGVPKVVGVHMGGQENDSNWAVRINADVAGLIEKWKAQ